MNDSAQRNALYLYYDKPVDRIAARLLRKAPDFCKLPEQVRHDLIIDPPRIKPSDVTFIFDRAPWTNEKQQAQDHRGEYRGVYLVIGHAGSKFSYGNKLGLHGGRNTVRCGRNPKTRANLIYRSSSKKIFGGRDKLHFWWVREPDGTISAIQWAHLRRLLPNETIAAMKLRKRTEREMKECPV